MDSISVVMQRQDRQIKSDMLLIWMDQRSDASQHVFCMGFWIVEKLPRGDVVFGKHDRTGTFRAYVTEFEAGIRKDPSDKLQSQLEDIMYSAVVGPDGHFMQITKDIAPFKDLAKPRSGIMRRKASTWPLKEDGDIAKHHFGPRRIYTDPLAGQQQRSPAHDIQLQPSRIDGLGLPHTGAYILTNSHKALSETLEDAHIGQPLVRHHDVDDKSKSAEARGT